MVPRIHSALWMVRTHEPTCHLVLLSYFLRGNGGGTGAQDGVTEERRNKMIHVKRRKLATTVVAAESAHRCLMVAMVADRRRLTVAFARCNG